MGFELSPQLSQYLDPVEMAQADSYVYHQVLAAIVARRLQRLREQQEHNLLLQEEEIDHEEYSEWKSAFDFEGKELAELKEVSRAY